MFGRMIMKQMALCLGLTQVMLIAGCSSMTSESSVRAGFNFSNINNVAVVDVVGAVQSEGVKAQIADEYSKQLLKKGYAPVQRDYIMRLLSDNNYTNNGLSPEAYAIEVGHLLGYEAVMIVNLTHFKPETSMTAKILEVKDGSALWIASGTTEIGTDAVNTMPDNPFDNPMFGQPAHPIQATVDNSPLSPKQMKQMSRLIERMCESLPDRSLPWMAVESKPTSSPDEVVTPDQPAAHQSRTYKTHKKIPVLWDLWPGNWGK